MRGGIVAVGIVMVFLGIGWYIIFGMGLLMRSGTLAAIGAGLCLLSPVLVIIGILVFIAGLIAKSPAELEAMRGRYPPPPGY